MMLRKIFFGCSAALFFAFLGGCFGALASDNRLYPGGVPPHQQTGVVTVSPTYSFRFVEKWRISHAWVQGENISPCRYRGNVFKRISGFPSLSREAQGPMVEHDGGVYSATTFEKTGDQIVFFELSYQLLGERTSDRRFEGKYTPFCGQFFPTSRNGMSLSIIKPDSAKGTDAWISGAASTVINGRTWLVKKVPPRDLSGTGLMQPIEYWTLKIPETPYWMHLTFSASLDYSVRQHQVKHEALLALFHQLIESVKLEPITPVDPSSMPPFVLSTPQAKQEAKK